jgi:hypothetical protein
MRAVAREVVDPAGVRWRVRRRWAPDRRLRPRWHGDVIDVPDVTCLGDEPGGVLAGVVIAVVVIVAAIVFVPLLLLLGEMVLFLAVAVLAVVGRVLLGRPWTLEAEAPETRLSWRVKGWGASRRAMTEIAAALARGQRPGPDLLAHDRGPE